MDGVRAMAGVVLQPWQIREFVEYVTDPYLNMTRTPTVSHYYELPLGNRLAGLGLIASTGNFATSLDFDSSDGLWLELCKCNIVFVGVWGEVADRTLAHAVCDGRAISMMYELVYVVARDSRLNKRESIQVSITRTISKFCLNPTTVRDFARKGVSERTHFDRKRKFVDEEYEVDMICQA